MTSLTNGVFGPMSTRLAEIKAQNGGKLSAPAAPSFSDALASAEPPAPVKPKPIMSQGSLFNAPFGSGADWMQQHGLDHLDESSRKRIEGGRANWERSLREREARGDYALSWTRTAGRGATAESLREMRAGFEMSARFAMSDQNLDRLDVIRKTRPEGGGVEEKMQRSARDLDFRYNQLRRFYEETGRPTAEIAALYETMVKRIDGLVQRWREEDAAAAKAA